MAMLGPVLLALGAPITLALRALGRIGRRSLLAVLQSLGARAISLAPVVIILNVGGLCAYYFPPAVRHRASAAMDTGTRPPTHVPCRLLAQLVPRRT
jgi:putative membrane protein